MAYICLCSVCLTMGHQTQHSCIIILDCCIAVYQRGLARGLSNEASHVSPVNHSMPSSDNFLWNRYTEHDQLIYC